MAQVLSSLSIEVIDTATVAGISLWALALYWAFSPFGQALTDRLIQRWTGQQHSPEGEPSAEPSVPPYYDALASLVALVPFLAGGTTAYGTTALTLGPSWAVSFGVISCMGCGIYELGRQNSQMP